MRILVTGAAGFIGFHLVRRLLDMGRAVVGLDNLNDYYSVQLEEDRLAILQENEGLQFIRLDLIEGEEVADLFAAQGVTHVVHLAAQPGVRYSLEAPEIYIQSNVAGLLHILEASRRNDVGHLLFASSSSVYGLNAGTPYNIHQSADHPVSLYGATKKAGEMMAHTYSHIYQLPCTALRFFTVYGPWGRPGMAPFLFAKAILEGRPINVFNHRKMRRSFTYVDDIIEGVIRVIDRIPQPDPE